MFAMFFVGAGKLFETPATGVGLIVAAGICLIGLIRRERGLPAPLVPVDLFAETTFRRTVVASACTFCAQVMSYVALPFHFQVALGADVLSTGLYLTAWPIAIIAVASFSGRLAARFPAVAAVRFRHAGARAGAGGGGGDARAGRHRAGAGSAGAGGAWGSACSSPPTIGCCCCRRRRRAAARRAACRVRRGCSGRRLARP